MRRWWSQLALASPLCDSLAFHDHVEQYNAMYGGVTPKPTSMERRSNCNYDDENVQTAFRVAASGTRCNKWPSPCFAETEGIVGRRESMCYMEKVNFHQIDIQHGARNLNCVNHRPQAARNLTKQQTVYEMMSVDDVFAVIQLTSRLVGHWFNVSCTG